MKLDMTRAIDIELTNRCNATCSFCPREKTPKQGFMDYETFRKAVSRAKEFDANAVVSLTGLGEPMLHPRFMDCIRHLHEQGLDPAFTTNASRMFRDVSSALLDAGLKRIDISVSDIGDDYKKVYNLDYKVTHQNICDFIELNQGRAKTQVTVVRHDGNQDKLGEVEDYWKSKGIDEVRLIREVNRGGSCSKEYFFQGSDKYKKQAYEALEKSGFSDLCGAPFSGIFIGWNGNYYLCCMDWEKTVPFDSAIDDVDNLKFKFLHGDTPLCDSCSVNPVNDLCEIMHEVEIGKRGKFAVANRLKTFKDYKLKEFADAIEEWRNSNPEVISTDRPIKSGR